MVQWQQSMFGRCRRQRERRNYFWGLELREL